MKLRNKLIPLISLTATATTIAPLATSCGNVSLSEIEMTDVLHGYLPDIARAEASDELSATQARDLYVDHVKKNPEIFAQDLYWWESLAMKQRLQTACFGSNQVVQKEVEGKSKINNDESFLADLSYTYGLYPITESYYDSFDMIPLTAKFGVSDLSINDVTLVNPNTQKQQLVYTISMKFNYDYEYELNADVANGITRYAAQRVTKASLTSEYKNVPFILQWSSDYACWSVVPMGWYTLKGSSSDDTTWMIKQLENWSFNFDFKCNTVDTIKNMEGGVDTYTYDDSKGGLIDSYAKLTNWLSGGTSSEIEASLRTIAFNFGSYHMYDIYGPRWSYNNLGINDMSYWSTKASDNVNHKIYLQLTEQINKNWTSSEYYEDEMPIETDSYQDTYPWKLNDVYCGSTKEFDLYLRDSAEPTKIGIVKFEPSMNTMAYKSEDITLNSAFASYNKYNKAAYFNLTFTLEIDVSTTEGQEIFDKLDAMSTSDIASAVTFTIPAETTFEFSVPYKNKETEKPYYKTEKCHIYSEHNCFWSSINLAY